MKSIHKSITLLLFLSLFTNLFAEQNHFREKHYSFGALLNRQSYVEISNQYGDIEFLTSENDSIKVEVIVKVNAKDDDQSEFDKMLNRIDINFRSKTSYVVAETKWDGATNFFAKGYQTIKSGFDAQVNNIQVDYKVYMPSTIDLTVKNKFGNIYLDNHSGNVDIRLSYGDLRARNLSNAKNIEVRYGKVKLHEVNNTFFKFSAVKYCEIEKANELRIESSSSDITIRNINSLDLKSRHDEISIEELGKLSGNGSLSDIKIRKLNEGINFTSKFGSIRVDLCSSTLTQLNLTTTRTDVNLKFSTSINALLSVDVLDSKYLSYNTMIKKDSEQMISEDFIRTTLLIGTKSNTKFSITSTKGYIDLSI